MYPGSPKENFEHGSSSCNHQKSVSFTLGSKIPKNPNNLGSPRMDCISEDKIFSSSVLGGSPAHQSRRSGSRSGKIVWRKVLYEKQPFEDNYVDPNVFLNELRKNSNVVQHKLSDVMMDSIAIAQNISVVLQFILMFAYVFLHYVNSGNLLILEFFLFIPAVLLQTNEGEGGDFGKCTPFIWRGESVLQVVNLGSFILLLSPILSSLTKSTSDDTIIALSVMMMTLHILVTDYRYLNAYQSKSGQNMAKNCAIFGVVMMVSRIPQGFDGVALLIFGVFCFSFSPDLRHYIRRSSVRSHLTFSAFLSFLIAIQLWFFSFFFLLVYLVMLTLVCLCIPACFVYLHKSCKFQINGPWDEAKPTNSAAAAEWANSGFLA